MLLQNRSRCECVCVCVWMSAERLRVGAVQCLNTAFVDFSLLRLLQQQPAKLFTSYLIIACND